MREEYVNHPHVEEEERHLLKYVMYNLKSEEEAQ